MGIERRERERERGSHLPCYCRGGGGGGGGSSPDSDHLYKTDMEGGRVDALPPQHLGSHALPQTDLGHWSGWHHPGSGSDDHRQRGDISHGDIHVGSLHQWSDQGGWGLLHDLQVTGPRVRRGDRSDVHTGQLNSRGHVCYRVL